MARASAAAALDRVNWDDVRLLLHVAQSGSFRAAANRVHISANTLRRRLSILEAELEDVLVDRSASGVRLTRAGIEVADVAERMSGQLSNLPRLAYDRRRGPLGTVSVAATDKLGFGWITPRLMNVGDDKPALTIEIRHGVRYFDDPTTESDIWIQLDRPSAPELVAARLGFLHLELFASKAYVAKYGAPTAIEEVARYHVVEQVSDELPLLSDVIPNPEGRRFVSVRVNTSPANFFAVQYGAGIGLLASYSPILTSYLVAIDCGFHMRREIWMAYHPRSKKLRQIRTAVAWIKEAFDSHRHPWFRETYMPANELGRSGAVVATPPIVDRLERRLHK